MKVLSTERSRQLAEQNGWSLAFSQGIVDGEAFCRLGKPPALHTLVGIDQYSLGFRAGFFERQSMDNRAGRVESAAKVIGQIRPR